MDPETAALAGTAGTTVVTLAATEGWQRARDGLVALWRHTQPERAEVVGTQLDETRDDLLAARADRDPDTEAELGTEWQGRLRRLLSAHPEAVGELRALLAELGVAEAPVAPSVAQRAHASGRARIYQAGRDQHFGPQ